MMERDPKRRRLTPLNAPFRSPLRRPPSASTTSSSIDASSAPSPLSNPQSVANPPLDASYSTPKRKQGTRTFKSPILGRNEDDALTPEIIALLHRKRDLLALIKQEQKAIETAELALQYEKQGEDEQLEKLIVKWRRCAQKTAEQVFVTARNRIDNMGGFREFMKGQKRQSTWNDDEDSEQRRQSDSQVEEYSEWEVPDPDEYEEDFTMDIMLKMAGVEEELIKWDRDICNFAKE